MKILHLISSSGLFGAENVLLTLAKCFNKEGARAVVGAIRDSRNPRVELIEKAKGEGLPVAVFDSRGRFDLGTVAKLIRYIKENAIDVLHTHNYKSDTIGLLAAKLTGRPLVATAHGFTEVTQTVGFYEELDRFLLKTFFDRVVVVTDKVLPHCPVFKKRVISNGLDASKFLPDPKAAEAVRKEFNIRPGDFVIGTIGRLSKEKNQLMLLEAAVDLVYTHPSVKFLIVGEGPEEYSLKHFVQNKNIADKIVFTGLIRDVVPVYQTMDAFVLSSVTEGVPLTILEAMASRVPVVATRVGGIPEIIEDGKTGFLVASKDVQALKAKLENLIRDRGLGQQLAEAGFHFVKQEYSLEKMCESYRKVYDELLPHP